MTFAVDRNIPLVEKAFGSLGNVTPLATPEIIQKNIRDADVLIVRSETKVDRSLLEDTRITFVGTVTIGTDHLDIDYLESRGIKYVSAPGCNANSVKEYLVAALLTLAREHNFTLKGKSIGVVGVGNVGSKVVSVAQALGMKVLQNDPPLARLTGEKRFLPLDDLMECDIITLHVPLTKSGHDPTFHLFRTERCRKLKHGTIFINTSRGAVMDSAALKEVIKSRRVSHAVVDVWENEPRIDKDLLGLVTLGTAHIAGYSLEGKVMGVRMIREAICRHFNLPVLWDPGPYMDPPAPDRFVVSNNSMADEEILHRVVRESYDIAYDDRQLRKISLNTESQSADYFMKLRSGYRMRREFSNMTVEIPEQHRNLQETFHLLGFKGHNMASRLKK
jgi:erythronate-4-phosphate dehydrogenase